MKKIILFLIVFAFLICFYLLFNYETKHFEYNSFFLFYIRLPKLVLGILVGIGLSVVGGMYQGIFKNPLAEPYLLGVSAGCAFGSVITYYFQWDKISILGNSILIFNSFISGLLTVGLIVFISNYKKNLNLMYLLLTGVIVNTLLFSIEFILITYSMGRMQNVLLWLFGSLPILDYSLLGTLVVIVILGSIYIVFQYKNINLLSISSEFLISKGMNLKKTSYSLFIISTLVVAAITSLCGIIGFIGLIVPHIIRLFFGYDFKKILTYSFIFGPIFIIASDILHHSLFYPREIPLGMMTTLLGAPLFFYLLRRNVRD